MHIGRWEPKLELASAYINRLNIETGKSEAKTENWSWEEGGTLGPDLVRKFKGLLTRVVV